ncbi:MAG TPA: hypothetical protein VFR40_02075 [Lapillicoccus sp.]|nr:hypothetical protein [Lapillicoccus sp.]
MMNRALVRWGVAAASAAGILVAGQLPADAKTTVGHGAVTFDDRQVVQLTQVGSQQGKGGLELHLTGKNRVIAGNLAVATTSCDGCHATAISFQVVIADRGPSGVDAGNVAYADNSGCADCEADAFAYQFVLAFDGNARMTGNGRHQLDRIDAALSQLARAGGSAAETQAAVDGYAAQVVNVLSSELRVRPVVKKAAIKRGHLPAA